MLAFRNLKRGVNLGLPSGQDVAKAMGIKSPLTPDEIATGADGATANKHGLHTATPLWYYILKEAEVRRDGDGLGPVGGTIVAEVLVGLVHGDHQSFLWRAKNWKPDLPAAKAGTFTMADMLRFVDDINPIGGAGDASPLRPSQGKPPARGTTTGAGLRSSEPSGPLFS